MRKDIERPIMYEKLRGGYINEYHPRDPKTVEISPGMILAETLEVKAEAGSKLHRAMARTRDGRVVVFVDILERQHLAKIERGDLAELPHFIDHSGHFIIDENAKLEGPSMWRRGRNIDEVKIVCKEDQDLSIRRINIGGGEEIQKELYDYFYMLGIWEVINPDDSIDEDVRRRFEAAMRG